MSSSGPRSISTSAVRQLYADPAKAGAQAIDKVAAARVWLMKEKPFFGVLARALVVEASLATPAFRLTIEDKLLINPLIVLEIKFPSLCSRMAHIAMHAALGAHVRRGQREPLKWNLAHDLALDPMLRAAGLEVGAGLGSMELPRGASAEEIYGVLEDNARPDDLWCDLSDPPSTEDPPPAGNFTRQDDDTGEDPNDSGGAPDLTPSDDTPTVEARGRALDWQMRLGAALEEEIASGGKTFGEMPGWIDALVRATIEPPPDWSATLQRSISTLTRADRTFLRPSRRQAALADADGVMPDMVMMPGRRVLPAGKLVAVIDTSASIEETTLERFLGALASVATAEGFDEIRLVQADAEVTRDETLFAADLLFQKVPITGRGGTDFGPAIRALSIEARREMERFTVVYLTDLDGKFPPASDAKNLEILWVVPGKVRSTPPFGRALEMAL
jgi:predicted metal-dependent peptidase